MITRRRFMQAAMAFGGVGALLSAYGVIVEPFYGLHVQRYALNPPRWNPQHRLRIVALADFHFSRPWMQEGRVKEIVDLALAQQGDIILLLGDYLSTMMMKLAVPPLTWSKMLARLNAPLGVHAILGNHDWWVDRAALERRSGPTIAGLALENAGIRVYENDAILLRKDNFSFWLTGLGDQIAFSRGRKWQDGVPSGIDDLPGMMAKVITDDPVIAMVHEPDAFMDMPERISLTLAGHTHGGQVRVFGQPLIVPSRFGRRYNYGHIVEEGRHLIVSGGLGCSILPVRIGIPPEIVVVDLGGDRAA